MSTPRRFASYTAARQQLRAVLDAASSGFVTTIDCDNERFLVVAADRQREDLAMLRPANAAVVAEGGGWAVILPALPVQGGGDTIDEAIDDVVDALREYAEDWNARLRTAPNHRQHHAVVVLVELSDDEQLRDWILGGARTAHADRGDGGDRVEPELLT